MVMSVTLSIGLHIKIATMSATVASVTSTYATRCSENMYELSDEVHENIDSPFEQMYV
jgi:hypothetical protein